MTAGDCRPVHVPQLAALDTRLRLVEPRLPTGRHGTRCELTMRSARRFRSEPAKQSAVCLHVGRSAI
jgi:hypothetical protein